MHWQASVIHTIRDIRFASGQRDHVTLVIDKDVVNFPISFLTLKLD
jgi:hypothetical protein